LLLLLLINIFTNKTKELDFFSALLFFFSFYFHPYYYFLIFTKRIKIFQDYETQFNLKQPQPTDMHIHQSNNTVTLCSLFRCRESKRKSHFPDLLRDQNKKRISDQIISHDTDSIRSNR